MRCVVSSPCPQKAPFQQAPPTPRAGQEPRPNSIFQTERGHQENTQEAGCGDQNPSEEEEGGGGGTQNKAKHRSTQSQPSEKRSPKAAASRSGPEGPQPAPRLGRALQSLEAGISSVIFSVWRAREARFRPHVALSTETPNEIRVLFPSPAAPGVQLSQSLFRWVSGRV